jgi:hypothetical protein
MTLVMMEDRLRKPPFEEREGNCVIFALLHIIFSMERLSLSKLLIIYMRIYSLVIYLKFHSVGTSQVICVDVVGTPKRVTLVCYTVMW